MSWVKVDDKAWSHPKFLALSGNAVRLWMFALGWCNSHETDGHVPKTTLRLLNGSPKDAAELVRVGLWDEAEDGWEVHDYLVYQPSAAENRSRREAKAEAGRAGGRRSGEARREAKPKHSRSRSEAPASMLVEPKRTPDPVPDPVPDPEAATQLPQTPRPAAPASVTRLPSTKFQTQNLPVQERAAYIENDKHAAMWLRPEDWPELNDLAARFSAALGLRVPKFAAYERDKAVQALVTLLATFDAPELDRAIAACSTDEWVRSKRLHLGSVTVNVVRQLLDTRPKAKDGPPEDDDPYIARKKREMREELGL